LRKYGVIYVLAFCLAVLLTVRTAAVAEETVTLPSRFGDSPGSPDSSAQPAAGDEDAAMVEEWLAATAGVPQAGVTVRSYMQNRTRKNFVFGVVYPVVQCRAGMITDVELEPGERVENIVFSDPKRWSVSAAWSGTLENMATHVLLRTQFPGLKANLSIMTDRRTYSLEFSSSLDGLHMPYIGFEYREIGGREIEPVPPGRWRDLLDKYDMLPGRGSPDSGKEAPKLVDGAEINTRYSIKPAKLKKSSKIPWTPIAVYDAGGSTYIAMPKNVRLPGGISIYAVLGDRRKIVPHKIAEGGLCVVNTLFDEAIMSVGADEIIIKRMD
jgi:type IV secretory pathway VirB9-like protein